MFPYIDSKPEWDDLWFLKKILLEETWNDGYLSISGRMRQFNSKDESEENLFTDWNAHSRCPNKTSDCGWGLGQLTVPIPTSQALWDWKSNIKEAVWLLTDLDHPDCKAHWVKHLFVNNNYAEDIKDWNDLNPNDKVELTVDYGGICWSTISSPIFSGIPIFDELFPSNVPSNVYLDSHSLLDACLIHCYNQGTPNPLFLKVKNNGAGVKPEWDIGDNTRKYVKRVSERPIPIN